MIAQDIIDRIIDTADIVQVIQEYVTLKKTGANYKCVCPFHEDHDASLVVSPSKKMWKCFGCGKGGNVISFLQEHEAISFPEAVSILAKKYCIELSTKELSEEEKKLIQKKESLLIAIQAAQDSFLEDKKDPEAKKYLASRNIPQKIIKDFGVGFAKDSFSYLYDTLSKKGYSQENLLEAGLINKKGDKIFDRFINRITFPFFDLSGRIIGFTGREIPKKGKESIAKYLNSPDSELFSKRKILYGIFQAKHAISKKDKVFLVEGQFDVLSLVAAGIENVVCGSGTAFTAEQARLIKKFTENVTIIYDGDLAGIKAASRNIDILLANGLKVRALLLPDNLDPDSFIHEKGVKKFEEFLKKEEVNFISFLWKIHNEELEDPIRKTEILENIANSIAAIPSKIARTNYITDLSNRFHANVDELKALVDSTLPPISEKREISNLEPGIYGLEDAQALIGQTNRELNITYSPSIFSEDWGVKPSIFVVGMPSDEDIQDIRSTSYVITCRDVIEIKDGMKEPQILEFLKKLYLEKFSITINVQMRTGEKQEKKNIEYSFLEYYISLYSTFRTESEAYQNIAIERCSELISYADSTTLIIRLKEYASQLGITKTALEKIIKPLLDKRKTEERFKNDIIDEDDDLVVLSASTLPDYVLESEDLMKTYNQFGFYPLLDKKNRKVSYIFKRSTSIVRVGNFYIEPLLHIYDKKSEANKRVVELTQRRMPYPIYMEWVSKDMITLQSFNQRLWDEGDIIFSNGTQNDLNTIRESWEGKFKRCTELFMYGYYPEGFFAFSNGIFHFEEEEWKFQPINDLGLVSHSGLNYYIPVFSKIYRDERRGNDKYYLDRFIRYREPKKPISFKKWAELMNDVYKENDNGKWAIIYTFMCAFRSDIFEVDRIFTAPFFIGPTGSGKSQIAFSIRSVFMPPEAPFFNLNQGTDAALFTLMEKYRNIPVFLDEYNDMQISDVKFQGLKAAVFDGEGKQKRKDAGSKELDTSEINAPLIICGQEAPQRDDNSLANRCIIRNVPKKDDRTEKEEQIFRELKAHEADGLHNILLQILQIRQIVRNNYVRIQREIFTELKNSVRRSTNNSDGLSRTLNTYSMFLSMCKIITKYTDFQLPFTYSEFEKIVEAELIKQVENISSSNRLYTFFSIIDTLIDNQNIIEGRDFKIEAPGKITLKSQGKQTYEKVLTTPDTNIIHLSVNNIYPHYARYAGNKEALSRASLMAYLESHETWIGRSKSTRMSWTETVEDISGNMIAVDVDKAIADNTMKKRRVSKSKITSTVVLNYDLLKELLDVDYQRDLAAGEDIEENKSIEEEISSIPF